MNHSLVRFTSEGPVSNPGPLFADVVNALVERLDNHPHSRYLSALVEDMRDGYNPNLFICYDADEIENDFYVQAQRICDHMGWKAKG